MLSLICRMIPPRSGGVVALLWRDSCFSFMLSSFTNTSSLHCLSSSSTSPLRHQHDLARDSCVIFLLPLTKKCLGLLQLSHLPQLRVGRLVTMGSVCLDNVGAWTGGPVTHVNNVNVTHVARSTVVVCAVYACATLDGTGICAPSVSWFHEHAKVFDEFRVILIFTLSQLAVPGVVLIMGIASWTPVESGTVRAEVDGKVPDVQWWWKEIVGMEETMIKVGRVEYGEVGQWRMVW